MAFAPGFRISAPLSLNARCDLEDFSLGLWVHAMVGVRKKIETKNRKNRMKKIGYQ